MSAPKGMLPFSTDWFMTWEQNIHASMFYNAYEFLMNSGQCTGVDVIVKAYRLYRSSVLRRPVKSRCWH